MKTIVFRLKAVSEEDHKDWAHNAYNKNDAVPVLGDVCMYDYEHAECLKEQIICDTWFKE